VGRDSPVGIVTGYGLDGQGIEYVSFGGLGGRSRVIRHGDGVWGIILMYSSACNGLAAVMKLKCRSCATCVAFEYAH
jgi:hypothetical protein